jgi:hypothetical protein
VLYCAVLCCAVLCCRLLAPSAVLLHTELHVLRTAVLQSIPIHPPCCAALLSCPLLSSPIAMSAPPAAPAAAVGAAGAAGAAAAAAVAAAAAAADAAASRLRRVEADEERWNKSTALQQLLSLSADYDVLGSMVACWYQDNAFAAHLKSWKLHDLRKVVARLGLHPPRTAGPGASDVMRQAIADAMDEYLDAHPEIRKEMQQEVGEEEEEEEKEEGDEEGEDEEGAERKASDSQPVGKRTRSRASDSSTSVPSFSLHASPTSTAAAAARTVSNSALALLGRLPPPPPLHSTLSPSSSSSAASSAKRLSDSKLRAPPPAKKRPASAASTSAAAAAPSYADEGDDDDNYYADEGAQPLDDDDDVDASAAAAGFGYGPARMFAGLAPPATRRLYQQQQMENAGASPPMADAFIHNALQSQGGTGLLVTAFKEVKFEKERNQRECLALCRIADALRAGNYREALELTVRRLAGVHTADTSDSWAMCDVLERVMHKQSFVPEDHLQRAVKTVVRMQAIHKKHNSNSNNYNRSNYNNRAGYGASSSPSGASRGQSAPRSRYSSNGGRAYNSNSNDGAAASSNSYKKKQGGGSGSGKK